MIVQVRHPRLYSRFTMRRLLFSFSFIISELALDVSESQCVAEKEGRRAGRGGGGGRFRTKHRGSSAYIMTAEAKAGAGQTDRGPPLLSQCIHTGKSR